MVGKRREQTVHHRHGQDHQQADGGVQTQETAAAAAAEPRQPVHEGAGPGGRGEEGPRGEAPTSRGPAGGPVEALGQRRAGGSEEGEEAAIRIEHQLPQHLHEGL